MNAGSAIITGASRGIGFAVARGLAAAGWRVALASSDAAALENAAAELARDAAARGRTAVFPFDVADYDAAKAGVEGVYREFGAIDLLFNNAGVNIPGTWEPEPAEFARVISVNLTGAWNMVRCVVPRMKEQGRGYIINLSSICGTIGFAGAGVYCASKFALNGLNESLFNELVPQGIKVTAICPSWVNTAMAQHCPFPAGRMIPPEAIYQTVSYLLSLPEQACPKEIVLHCGADV